jgi:hypothetical protein
MIARRGPLARPHPTPFHAIVSSHLHSTPPLSARVGIPVLKEARRRKERRSRVGSGPAEEAGSEKRAGHDSSRSRSQGRAGNGIASSTRRLGWPVPNFLVHLLPFAHSRKRPCMPCQATLCCGDRDALYGKLWGSLWQIHR